MAAVYSLVPTWTAIGQVMQNVLHFQLDESGTGTASQRATALITAFESGPLPAWLDCLSTEVALRSIRCKRVTGGGGPTQIKLYAPEDFPGARAGVIGTTMECPLLEFPVLLHSKNVTGKIFIGGVPDDGIEENGLSTLINTAVNALGASMVAPLTLAGSLGVATFTIYNREFHVDTIPTSHTVSVFIGNQRRRIRPQ